MKGVSAAGGLPTDGTCTPIGYDSTSYYKLFHRLTCGGSSGPQYDYFRISYSSSSANPCSGTPYYSIKGSATTTDSTCLTPAGSGAGFFSVELQCTEKIYQDRSSTTYYTYSNSSCDGTPVIGPLYDVPLGTCTASTSTDTQYLFLNGNVYSSALYCSFDGAYTLSTDYADAKCDTNSWVKMSASKTGQCKSTYSGAFSSTSQFYYKKYSCPSNPPTTALRPVFPPDVNAYTDVAVRYSCDFLNCTSCYPSTAYKLGMCSETTNSFPPTSDVLTSTKRGCTQDGKNFGLSTHRDGQCQSLAIKTELAATLCSNTYGSSPYYVVCPTAPKAAAQLGPLPAVARIIFARANCTAPTTEVPAAFLSASYVGVGCLKGNSVSANSTTIVQSQYYSGTGVNTCSTSVFYSSVYQSDVCIDSSTLYNSPSSSVTTSRYSTSSQFADLASTGTATSDSVKPPVYGEMAYIVLSTPTSLFNSTLWKNEYLRCASTFTSTRASRITVSVSEATSGSSITLTFAPSVVPGDTTPAAAVGLLLAKSGKLPSNLIYDSACDPVNGIVTSSGGSSPTIYGSTAKFSMVFNIAFDSITESVKAQLIREVAAVGTIDASRLSAPSYISRTGSSQTTVYFEITPSTDGTVTTPSAALQLITAKVESSGGMPGTYASQAVQQAPTVTADGKGGSSAASANSVNIIMQLAVALAAIVALLQ